MMFSLSSLFVFTSLLFSGTFSLPTPEVGIESRADSTVPSTPHFVIYSDKWVSGETGPPQASTLKVRAFLNEAPHDIYL